MDLSNRTEIAVEVISVICICFVMLCCGAYIFSKKQYKKQNQIHLTNQRNPSLTPTQIFTLDVADVLPLDSSNVYLPNEPPPSFESVEKLSSEHHHHKSIVPVGSSLTIE